jgi:hypothetical protein
MKTLLSTTFIALIFTMHALAPSVAYAQNQQPVRSFFNVVPCGNEQGEAAAKSCDFQDFLTMIRNIIRAIIILSIPATMIVLTWIGVVLLTAQGDVGKITRSKIMAKKVIWGFIIVLSAWLVVEAIFVSLTGKSFNELLK